MIPHAQIEAALFGQGAHLDYASCVGNYMPQALAILT